MRRYAALVVSVTVALVLFPSPYECTAGDHPDKLQILSLLEKRDFAALDRLLATLQENSGRKGGQAALKICPESTTDFH